MSRHHRSSHLGHGLLDIVHLAPLLFAGCIAEMVRTPVVPDVLRDLLPGNSRRLSSRPQATEGVVCAGGPVARLGARIDGLAEKLKL